MKLLVAYDGFDHSLAALESVARLAGSAGSNVEVTVLSVVPPDARGSKSGGHIGLRPHAHEDIARGHEYLAARGLEATMKIAHGEPAEEIVAEAETSESDLLVMGSRQRGSVARLLLGSVSEEVSRRAPCPVVVAVAKGATSA